MEQLLTITTAGKTEVRNIAAGATTYRAEFPGAGSVTFFVQPGASFNVVCERSPVNVYIEAFFPGFVRALDD